MPDVQFSEESELSQATGGAGIPGVNEVKKTSRFASIIMKTGIVKTEKAANAILLILIVIIVAISIYILVA